MNRSTHESPPRPSRRMWWLSGILALIGITVVSGLAWRRQDAQESTRLARDTRIVVRVPETVIDRLTADEVREEFPIEESTDELKVTGTARAAGHVTIRIERHQEHDRHDDAMVNVKVVGHTDNHLVGHHTSAVIIGAGRGEFEAHKQVHFDGLEFTTTKPTTVEATHETEIVDVAPTTTSAIQGAVRLLASRRARSALPELNQLAAARIEETVQRRVDELVDEAVRELNRLNKLEETVARLHPDSEHWHIDVDSRDGFVQAALVPEGGTAPRLPAERPTAFEVWIRLTRTQRTGVNLVSQWNESHRLFRRYVPDEVAHQMPEDVRVASIEGWTRLQIGPQTGSPRIAAGVGAQ
jgi:hypothetical protein